MSEKINNNDVTGYESVDFDPFQDGEILSVVPSTEAQKEIWASAQFGDGANCAFNESMSFHVSGDFKPQVFKDCILDVIRRHDALRATFSTDGSTMSIAANLTIEIPIVDLTVKPDGGSFTMDDYLLREAMEPFDLARGPLVRATILKLAERSYRVLFSAHHIICDGWSMSVVIQDLRRIYQAKIDGGTPDLPVPYRFIDYAVEDDQQRVSTRGGDSESFWLSLYAHEVPVLDFPTDRPRPAMRTFDAERIDFTIDSDIVQRLKKTGAKFGCTFIISLIAAFKTYLHRLTSQNTIVLGTPAAGQLATGRDLLVGHCVNLLPLISTLNPSQPFSEYLRTVRNLMFDANQHQRYTFGSLIKKLKIPRDPSRIPLIPIIFNVDQQTKEDELELSGINFDVSTNSRKFENFELFLNLKSSARGHKVIIECTYNKNLFNEETIQYRLAEFEALLASVADSPESPLSDIPLLPNSEKHRLVVEFNDTAMEYPKDKCFYQLFEEQAAAKPDHVAVECKGETITYAVLNKKANQLANYLASAGVGPDELVGLFVDRSIDMMVGLLGILKAGGAYVPLDPDYPPERLSYMLEESNSSVLITQKKFESDLPDSGARVVFIDSDWNRIGEMSDANPDRGGTGQGFGPQNLAYVIFTSGSTGKPKGVQVPHRAVTNFLSAMLREPGIIEEDTMLAVTTTSFDIHVLELYLPLIAGAKVVLADRETTADGTKLVELLDQSDATIMQATPSTWRLMIDAGWKESRCLKVLCGGEAFPKDLVGELLNRVGQVWNMYGPTETTVWSTCCQLKDTGGPVFIGKPIGNTRTYVLDGNMKLLPIGVPGELYIGGDSVTRGYLNRSDLTQAAFFQDPFSGEPNAVMYKTGDLVRHHSDGIIEYLSRLDNQVKVRGFRIELGEIETVLSKHETIKQAVCVVKDFGLGDTRLAAHIVKQSGCELDNALIRNHLRKSLPAYMIPQHFIEIDDIPLTPAGKVDRKKLIADFEVGSEIGTQEYVAPVTPTEISVAQIWSEVLNAEKIGKTDNFFEIGGHSLIATRVVSRINRTFGLEMKLGELFLSPTIEGLAVVIDKYNQSVENDLERETMEF